MRWALASGVVVDMIVGVNAQHIDRPLQHRARELYYVRNLILKDSSYPCCHFLNISIQCYYGVIHTYFLPGVHISCSIIYLSDQWSKKKLKIIYPKVYPCMFDGHDRGGLIISGSHSFTVYWVPRWSIAPSTASMGSPKILPWLYI